MIATAFLAAAGLSSFVVLVVAASIAEHVSPLQAIFGPLPGTPLIVWLTFVVLAVALQGAVALTLREQSAGRRAAGTTGAAVIVLICVLWLAAVAVDGARWIASGELPGDEGDVVGVAAFGVSVAAIVLVLNARAAMRGWRAGRHQDGATRPAVSPVRA